MCCAGFCLASLVASTFCLDLRLCDDETSDRFGIGSYGAQIRSRLARGSATHTSLPPGALSESTSLLLLKKF